MTIMKSPEDLLLAAAASRALADHQPRQPRRRRHRLRARPGAPAAQAGQGRHDLEPRPDAGDLPRAARQPTASTSARSRRAGFPDDFDTVVVLECPSLDRTGLEGAARRHDAAAQHRPPPRQPALRRRQLGRHGGARRRRDGAAPGPRAQLEIDPDTAACLYLALVSDTGGFRFSNATPRGVRGRVVPGRARRPARARLAVALREPARRRAAPARRDARRRSRSRAAAGSPPRC